jgi:hypothetical protein
VEVCGGRKLFFQGCLQGVLYKRIILGIQQGENAMTPSTPRPTPFPPERHAKFVRAVISGADVTYSVKDDAWAFSVARTFGPDEVWTIPHSDGLDALLWDAGVDDAEWLDGCRATHRAAWPLCSDHDPAGAEWERRFDADLDLRTEAGSLIVGERQVRRQGLVFFGGADDAAHTERDTLIVRDSDWWDVDDNHVPAGQPGWIRGSAADHVVAPAA